MLNDVMKILIFNVIFIIIWGAASMIINVNYSVFHFIVEYMANTVVTSPELVSSYEQSVQGLPFWGMLWNSLPVIVAVISIIWGVGKAREKEEIVYTY